MAEFDDMENVTVGRNADSKDDKDKSASEKEKEKRKKKQAEDVDKADKKAEQETDKEDSDDEESGGDKNGGDKKKGIGNTVSKISAAAEGATVAGKVAFMAQLLNMLKILFQMIQQLVAAAVAAIANVIASVVAVVMQVVTAVAVAAGVSVAVAAFGIFGAIFVAAVVVVGVVVSAVQANEVAKYDGPLEDCSVVVDEAKSDASDLGADASMLKHAQLAYSFYSTYGAPDEHIAGILGNWTHESGIDPTSIEGIYTEKYSVDGSRKASAVADLNSYTLNKLFPMYANSGLSINQNAYKAGDGKYYCGLGLGQWTGPRALHLIETAVSADMPWYSMELQLIFSISTDSGKSTLDNWFSKPEANPSTAAEYFMRNWEGIVNGTLSGRQQKAEEWYAMMGEWVADVDYANSLIELAGVVKLEASGDAVKDALNDCQSERKKYDNSSIAHAAVQYAYTNYEDSKKDNGTTLYQTVHDVVYPGDPYYASCDRGTAVAVKWSGYDVSFPAGACSTQYSYCMSSPKWQKITWNGNQNKLEPGDVLICNSCHTLMYVGQEVIREVWGDDVIDALPKYGNTVAFVEASYGNRSPGLVPLWGNYVNGSANGSGHVHSFAAFRCIDPDRSDIYDHAADGVDTHIDVPWDKSPYGS